MFLLLSQKYNRIVATHSEGVQHYHLTQLQILQRENKESSFTKTNQLNFEQQKFQNSVCIHNFSEKSYLLFFPPHEISVALAVHCHIWKHFRATPTVDETTS